jgi:hypothetical protein
MTLCGACCSWGLSACSWIVVMQFPLSDSKFRCRWLGIELYGSLRVVVMRTSMSAQCVKAVKRCCVMSARKLGLS